MKVDVYNSKGSKTDKSVTLNKAVFGIEPNDHAIYLDVKRYRAAQRQGTHDTLHRGLVSGSTRKIKKQKGTGTAQVPSRIHCFAVEEQLLARSHVIIPKS